MPQLNDLSRSLAPFAQRNTLVAVIELSLSSWLIAGVVPGIERQPLKKLEPDEGGHGIIKTVRGVGYVFVPDVEPA